MALPRLRRGASGKPTCGSADRVARSRYRSTATSRALARVESPRLIDEPRSTSAAAHRSRGRFRNVRRSILVLRLDGSDDDLDGHLRHRARALRRPLERRRDHAACCCPTRDGRPGPAFEDGVAVPAFVRRRDRGHAWPSWPARPRDLRDVPLDERGIDDFRRAVYAATRDDPRRARPAATARSPGRSAGPDGRPRRRRGARPQPVPDHRPVPPRRRGERGAHRVLGAGRPGDEAPDARARGRARLRPAGAVWSGREHRFPFEMTWLS